MGRTYVLFTGIEHTFPILSNLQGRRPTEHTFVAAAKSCKKQLQKLKSWQLQISILFKFLAAANYKNTYDRRPST